MSWCMSKCLRKASIYSSLEVGERHVSESEWWHMSQPDWRSFKTFPPRHVASFDWPKCFYFQGDTCQHPIGLPVSSLTRAGLLMSLLTHADAWLVFECILCPYFNDTWEISIGFWIVIGKPRAVHKLNKFLLLYIKLLNRMACQHRMGIYCVLSCSADTQISWCKW